MHLKSDCAQFSKEDHIKEIIKKYSNFVGYPIVVNGDRINLIQPIWLEDPKNITEEQYEEFYTFIGNYDKPRFTFQYKTDSPLNIRALFYVPKLKPSKEALLWFADQWFKTNYLFIQVSMSFPLRNFNTTSKAVQDKKVHS